MQDRSKSVMTFQELGVPVGSIEEGVHAGAPRGGIYHHPQLGRVFVKQDEEKAKNFVEWVFYQVAFNVFAIAQQRDLLARLAPIILVVPKEEQKNTANEIYVGSVAHENMELAWKKVYKFANPDADIPKTRPGGFEHFNKTAVNEYIAIFNQHDPGFSMLPAFMLLGHYATHLGNLGIEAVSNRLLFFDYGAAAWYDLSNSQFDHPVIRGNIKDSVASFFSGVSKNYASYYSAGIYTDEAIKRLGEIYQVFQQENNQAKLYKKISHIIDQLNQVVTHEALIRFAHYLGIVNEKHELSDDKKLTQHIKDYLFQSILNRMNYIPTYLEVAKQSAQQLNKMSSVVNQEGATYHFKSMGLFTSPPKEVSFYLHELETLTQLKSSFDQLHDTAFKFVLIGAIEHLKKELHFIFPDMTLQKEAVVKELVCAYASTFQFLLCVIDQSASPEERKQGEFLFSTLGKSFHEMKILAEKTIGAVADENYMALFRDEWKIMKQTDMLENFKSSFLAGYMQNSIKRMQNT